MLRGVRGRGQYTGWEDLCVLLGPSARVRVTEGRSRDAAAALDELTGLVREPGAAPMTSPSWTAGLAVAPHRPVGAADQLAEAEAARGPHALGASGRLQPAARLPIEAA